MNIHQILPSEAFAWSDQFSKATGLSTAESMQVLAELANFQTSSKLLAALIEIEEERNTDFANALDLESPDELIAEGIDVNDVEYFDLAFAFDCEYRFDPTEHTDSVISLMERHHTEVLTHHKFADEFIFFFQRHLNPMHETPADIPEFDKDQVFYGSFDPAPFFLTDPQLDEDEDEDGEPHFLENAMRMAVSPHPAGWVAVMEHLGFEVKAGSVTVEREWNNPAFTLVDNGIETPVYILHPAKRPYDDEDVLCNNLRSEIQSLTRSNALIFWHGPMSTGPEEDDRSITFWGELLVDTQWLPLTLRPSSTSLAEIFKDGLIIEHEITESTFNKVATADRTLIDVWMNNHTDLLSEMIGGFTQQLH